MNNLNQTVMTNSTTTTNEAGWLDILQYTLFTLIFVVSAIGNTLVCLVIATTRRMRTTRNYLLVNLAVSDLTVALLCIPFDMVVKITEPEWQLGDAMCKLLWPSMTLVTNSSAATLAVISYDRYRAVIRPMKFRFTTRQTGIVIATIWLVSLALVLPYLLALRVIGNQCDEVWPRETIRKIYTVGLFLFQYALPLTIIAIAYIKVVLRLREQSARMTRNYELAMKPPSPPPTQENCNFKTHLTPESYDKASLASPLPAKKEFFNRFDKGKHKKHYRNEYLTSQTIVDKQTSASPLPNQRLVSVKSKRRGGSGMYKEARRLEHNTKILKMLVSVVLSYAICLLPNQVVWLWTELGSGQSWSHINELLIFGSLMVYINSSVNPLLYAGMNEEFRKEFGRILRCRWKERQAELQFL